MWYIITDSPVSLFLSGHSIHSSSHLKLWSAILDNPNKVVNGISIAISLTIIAIFKTRWSRDTFFDTHSREYLFIQALTAVKKKHSWYLYFLPTFTYARRYTFNRISITDIHVYPHHLHSRNHNNNRSLFLSGIPDDDPFVAFHSLYLLYNTLFTIIRDNRTRYNRNIFFSALAWNSLIRNLPFDGCVNDFSRS